MFLPSNITLQFGDSGDFVSELQRRLATINVHSADAVSGLYDGATVNSVSSFQARSGLRADGIAGPETLRRLNGIISGDTSSSSDKKEEDATKQLTQDAFAHPAPLLEVPENIEPMVERRNLEERRPDPVAPPEPMPEAVAPHVSSGHLHEQIQQQLTRDQQMIHDQQVAAVPMSSGDLLAQMLLQQTQPTAAKTETHAHSGSAHAAEHTTPDHHAPHAAEAKAHADGGIPAAQASTAAAAETAGKEPRGLIARAMQKVDALVQKLTEYFEAKLPTDVLREVKEAGQVMLQNGVREARIPAGPEPVRGLTPSLPSRGPEAQTSAPAMPQRS